MRRLLSIFTLTFLASMVLLAFAVPSFAEEASVDHAEATEAEHGETMDAEHADVDDAEHADDASHAEDEDQWLGLKGSLVVGVLLGLGAFVMSGTKGLGEEAHH